ncbi:MAG: hypothetical protein ICV87_15515, partial [Gemmatimonadetes bacterium]|nr:hypothetical protein [Gemmatimonadota bacterium]
MSYVDTFILVAEDCPVRTGVVPTARGRKGEEGKTKTIPVLQYELLSQRPYGFTHESLLFAVHVRHKGISEDELATRGDGIRAELFGKPHPWLRASPLPKRYGWGVHYDAQGRIALYGMEAEAYRD